MKRVRHDNHYQIAQHCAKKHRPNVCGGVPQITNALCTTFKYESHPTQPNTTVISLVSDDENENDDPPLRRLPPPPPLHGLHAIQINLPPSRATAATTMTACPAVVLPPPVFSHHNHHCNGVQHHLHQQQQQHTNHGHLVQYAQIASSSSSQSAASKGSAASDASSSSSSSSSSSEDTNKESSSSLYSVDSNGYLVFRAGLVMLDRYKLVRSLGKGTFSRVFECNEIVPYPRGTTRATTPTAAAAPAGESSTSRYKRTGRKFAIKVVRNVHKYRLAARIELRILQRIRDHDTGNSSNCIHLVEHAEYRQHPLLVFPLYGRSVYSFMVEHGYKPFALDDVVHLMHQLLVGVDYVHSLNIIITDLKPENIVLVRDDTRPCSGNTSNLSRYLQPQSTQIKLIDFGSAVVHEHGARHSHLIQTRHYRAPEVVFKLAWSFSADIWSVGCILVELVFGKMLFNTHCNIDHINQMVKCIGSPPRFLLESIDDDTWDELFDASGNLNTFKAKISKIQCKALWEYFVSSERNPLAHQLYELCTRLLTWSPSVRWTARDALQHPVFRRYHS